MWIGGRGDIFRMPRLAMSSIAESVGDIARTCGPLTLLQAQARLQFMV